MEFAILYQFITVGAFIFQGLWMREFKKEMIFAEIETQLLVRMLQSSRKYISNAHQSLEFS